MTVTFGSAPADQAGNDGQGSTLLTVRQRLATVLAKVDDTDPPVISSPIDAVTPPMLVVGWRTPMVDNWAACVAMANLWVLIIAGRLDMPAGHETIEKNYQRVQQLLRAHQFGIEADTGIGSVEIARTTYLGCRIDVHTPIGL